jgi:excinuclease ABC subunit A
MMSSEEKLRANGVETEDAIEVFGARVHNLKNIDIKIPKNKLVVITGISGSGKSSLAFDTIYSEGQRRYMESFGAYARQFIGDMERPDVDKITGLSPVISIEQKTTNKNPRSTVGTVTEVYDFLRLLYARIGEAYSYNTGKKMVKFSEEEIVENIFKKFRNKKISLLAPVVRGRKGHYRELFEDIRKKGYLKARVDGEIKDLVAKMQVDRYKIHDIEVVIDRLAVTADMKTRLSQSVQKTLQVGKDLMFVLVNEDDKTVQYAKQLMCEDTGISYEEPSPNSFSFNSPYGACPFCKGLGSVYQVSMEAIIPDFNKSINAGAIVPLGEEREAYVFKQVQQLAKKNKFSLDIAIKDLPKRALNQVLYGNDAGPTEVEIGFEEATTNGQIYATEYEGIINQLNRWFAGGTTDALRDWVEKFMELKICETCNGQRLKKESLWFKIDEKNISQLSAMNLNKLMQQTKYHRKRYLKRDTRAIAVFIGCGTYLSFFESPIANPEWRRISADTPCNADRLPVTRDNLHTG